MSRDFVASCYEVFLGRDLESSQVADERRRLTRPQLLVSVAGSDEFVSGVAGPLRDGRALPEHLYHHPLTWRHRFWAADELPVTPSSGALLQEAPDWRTLMAVLAADPLLCEVVGFERLRLQDHPEPALRALEERRLQFRRPIRETEDAIGDFGRMLQTYCGEVFANLESVGDNCELGGLQRAAGVDTPGLFRWSGVKAEALIRLLDEDVAGVEDPAHVSLRVWVRSDWDAEYMLDHALLGADAHTFVRPGDASAEEVLDRELKRLMLLQRKFREDIRSGRRLFVYRSAVPMDDELVLRLHDAFRRRGPNRLLVVRPAEEGLAAGEVAPLRPDLAVGALDDFALGMEMHSELWPGVLMRAARLLPPTADLRAAA